MRILLVGINYAPDLIGVAKYNTELCESLAAAGHDVQVVTAPPYYPAWRIPGEFDASYFRAKLTSGVAVTRTPIYVPAHPSGTKRLIHHASFALSSSITVLQKVLLWRPDVVLSVAPSLMSAAFVALVARLTGTKSWLHVQDFEVDAAFDLGLLRNDRLRRLMLRTEARIIRSFDRISTISPQMLDRLARKGIAGDKLSEVRNWIDTNAIAPGPRQTRYRDELGLKDSDLVALYSGTMSNKQGLDLVIEAATVLDRAHPDIHFVLAGDGPHKAKLMSQASRLSNTHFLGLQPYESFGELMATADIHVLPQRAEAADLVLPSKLGAIFASARPVIAMARPDTGLAIEVNGAGLVIEPGDSAALAAAIWQLGEDRGLARQLAEEGRKRAVARWDRNTIIAKWADDMAPREISAPKAEVALQSLPIKDQVRLSGERASS
jgi:putative colanic acid biosynthesis glycosyltransferase WcaI